MSEFARAWSRSGLGRVVEPMVTPAAYRKKMKEVFRAGWEAREVLANRRIEEAKRNVALTLEAARHGIEVKE